MANYSNRTHKKVHFIGSGYESVKQVIVEAETARQAIDRALELYADNGWSFHYCEPEVAKCL